MGGVAMKGWGGKRPVVETLSGFMWGVYPREAGDPLVASGGAASVDQARREVERVLIIDSRASWGAVTGPGGYHSTCHRGRADTFSWDQKSSGTPAPRSGRPRDARSRRARRRSGSR